MFACPRYYVPKAFLPLILTLGGALQRQLCVKDSSGVIQTPYCQDPVYTMTQVNFHRTYYHLNLFANDVA
jgi:hypothetical protein